MPLSAFQNTFAGNPLNRASERRVDHAWLAEQLNSDASLAVALWNGKPFVENAKDGGLQIAYLPARMAEELSGGAERLLFLGLWQETAVFAVDLEGGADPADGPLAGLGRFEDLRAVALRLPATDAAIMATSKQMFEWRRRHRNKIGDVEIVGRLHGVEADRRAGAGVPDQVYRRIDECRRADRDRRQRCCEQRGDAGHEPTSRRLSQA